MAVQQEFPTKDIMNTHHNIKFDYSQALEDVVNSNVSHPIDSFINEMTSKECDLNDTQKPDLDAIVLSEAMTSDTASNTLRTHKRTVTMDIPSPARVSSDDLKLTAEDWKIGAEQLLDIEPTPVSELMKKDPIPLVAHQVPESPSPTMMAPEVNPPLLTLPEEMPVATMPTPVFAPTPTVAPPIPPAVMSALPLQVAAPMSAPPLQVAATVSAPPPHIAAAPINAPVVSAFSSPVIAPKPLKPKRTRRRKEAQPVIYVDEPTDLDCVLGRGGKSNHHPGNKRYRAEVQNLQKWYKASGKSEKTDLSQHLVNFVHGYGGRFVKQEKSTGRWYVVSNMVARRKASQALREHLSMEERQARKAAKLAAALPSN